MYYNGITLCNPELCEPAPGTREILLQRHSFASTATKRNEEAVKLQKKISCHLLYSLLVIVFGILEGNTHQCNFLKVQWAYCWVSKIILIGLNVWSDAVLFWWSTLVWSNLDTRPKRSKLCQRNGKSLDCSKNQKCAPNVTNFRLWVCFSSRETGLFEVWARSQIDYLGSRAEKQIHKADPKHRIV